MKRMTQREIQNWLTYWSKSNLVAIDQINAFDQVHQARKYCACMRSGGFSYDLVSDLKIWRALENMRDPKKYPEREEVRAAG